MLVIIMHFQKTVIAHAKNVHQYFCDVMLHACNSYNWTGALPVTNVNTISFQTVMLQQFVHKHLDDN